MSCQKIKWDSSGTSVDWSGSKTYKVSWVGCSETPDDPVDPDPTCADSVITAIDGVTKSISNATSAGLDGLVAKAGVTPTSIIINSGNKIPYNTGLGLECGSNVKLFTDAQMDASTTVVETVFKKTSDNTYAAGRYGASEWAGFGPVSFQVAIIKNGNTDTDRTRTVSKYITFAGFSYNPKTTVYTLHAYKFPTHYKLSDSPILTSTGSLTDLNSSNQMTGLNGFIQVQDPKNNNNSQVIDIETGISCQVKNQSKTVDNIYNIIFTISNVTTNDIVIIKQYGRMCLSGCGANYLNIMSGHFSAKTELPCLYYTQPSQIFIWPIITDWSTNNGITDGEGRQISTCAVYCVNHSHAPVSNLAISLKSCTLNNDASVNFQATGGTIEQYLLTNKNNSIDNLV